MPYKSDDFQNLFQKAGKDYPLRTDNSNWNDVAAKLSAAANEPKVIKGIFLKYAVIFLLLISGSIIFYKLQFYTVPVAEKVESSERKLNSPETTGKSNELNLNGNHKPDNIKTNLSFSSLVSAKEKNKQPVLFADRREDKVSSSSLQKTALVAVKPPKFHDAIIGSSKPIEYNHQVTEILSGSKLSEDAYNNQKISNIISPDNTNSTKQVINFRSAPPKFYGTFYASPVFSLVNFQKIKNPGYKIAVGLGYSINERFDLEIGLQREHINFYSDGKYFDKKGLKIRSDQAVLENIDGHSKITSVPVTLKYNFAQTNNDHFYSGVGFNLVKMTHSESYDYVILKNRNERNRSKEYRSISDPKYFTDIIVSAGYEAKACNWFNMKAEPYYQIPIQHFGAGKLPVTSFGINVGIIARLR